jgi:hypothetical protein
MLNLLAQTFGLQPFDPKKHTPQDLGLGGLSTEYLATEYDNYGLPFNYPTIWFDPSGAAHYVPDAALSLALDYEAATGAKFPRFENIGQAVELAQHRSALGGAAQGLLAKLGQ